MVADPVVFLRRTALGHDLEGVWHVDVTGLDSLCSHTCLIAPFAFKHYEMGWISGRDWLWPLLFTGWMLRLDFANQKRVAGLATSDWIAPCYTRVWNKLHWSRAKQRFESCHSSTNSNPNLWRYYRGLTWRDCNRPANGSFRCIVVQAKAPPSSSWSANQLYCERCLLTTDGTLVQKGGCRHQTRCPWKSGINRGRTETLHAWR